MKALSKLDISPQGRLSVVSRTTACASGTVTITVNDHDNNLAVSGGDTIVLDFSMCREDPNLTMDGKLVVAIQNATESPPTVQFGGTFTFPQFVVTDSGYTSSISGAMHGVYEKDMYSTSSRLESTIATTGLIEQDSTPSFSETFTYTEGFSSVVQERIFTLSGHPLPPGTLFTTLKGTVHFASLSGLVTLLTPSAVEKQSEIYFPHSGQVLVSGNASQLRLTPLNSDRVRLELDADNDAAFEDSKELTWTELMQ
jgi:hypothetical protein